MSDDYRAVRGRIFNIQKFSVHDGPGIRTIIFLKGCALRCRWCCNPESQEFCVQKMQLDDGSVKIMGRDVTAGEIIDEVMKDYPYYRRSGGGITLSGGECLLQPDFSEALLRGCKDLGVSTAIESAGFASVETILKLLPHIDCFLMDIKHMDSKKHKEFTGQPNERILANAAEIAKRAKKLVIRVPVIPGFNDTEREISDIAAFAAGLSGVEEINLLPYHRMGSDKYRWLGREYTLSEIMPPEESKMQRLADTAQKHGIRCIVGG